jgi:hypothetical protein
MRRTPVASLLASVAVLLPGLGVLTGCGQAVGTTAAASSTASAGAGGSTAATAAATTVSEVSGGSTGTPPFVADVQPDTAEAVDPAGLTVTAVRVGAHDGFDRVVFELAGEGTPGWDVQYMDAATAEGSGDPIDLAGPAYLRVVIRGTSYPYESGATEASRGPVALAGTTAVTGAFYDGTFEGQSLGYVGTRSQAPFRVYALSGPARVVVEVATS